MSEMIPQKEKGEHDQWLDVERLIEAVKGSQAARVLFAYRGDPHSFSPAQNALAESNLLSEPE